MNFNLGKVCSRMKSDQGEYSKHTCTLGGSRSTGCFDDHYQSNYYLALYSCFCAAKLHGSLVDSAILPTV